MTPDSRADGIARRHLAENETTFVYGGRGGEKSTCTVRTSRRRMWILILVATSTPENVFPCTACEVQRRFMQSMRRDLI